MTTPPLLTNEQIDDFREFIKNGSTGYSRKKLIMAICAQAKLAAEAEIETLRKLLRECRGVISHGRFSHDYEKDANICRLCRLNEQIDAALKEKK